MRMQLRFALCACLLVAFLKFRSRQGHAVLQILRPVQRNVFEQRDLVGLLCPNKQKIPLKIKQLELLQFNGAAVIRQIRIK